MRNPEVGGECSVANLFRYSGVQRDPDVNVQRRHRSRLSHRYRDIYNTLTQGLARTCAVPPMHCVLAELERGGARSNWLYKTDFVRV